MIRKITTMVNKLLDFPKRSEYGSSSDYGEKVENWLEEEKNRSNELHEVIPQINNVVDDINIFSQEVENIHEQATSALQTANTAISTATQKADEASQSATNATASATQASSSAQTASQKAKLATQKANEANNYAQAMANNLIDDTAPKTDRAYSSQKTQELLDKKPNKNYIVNGGLQIWQRGTEFAVNRFTADRWFVNFSGATGIVKKIPNTDILGGVTDNLTNQSYFIQSPNRLQFKMNSKSDYAHIATIVENAYKLLENTYTYSAWVYSTKDCELAMTANIFHNNNNNLWKKNKNVNLQMGWNKIVHTFDIPVLSLDSSIDIKDISIFYAIGNVGTEKIDIQICDVKLEKGEIATPFELEDYAVELLKCQRYYEVINGYSFNQYSKASQKISYPISFHTEKAKHPTIQIIQDYKYNLSGDAVPEIISTNGFRFAWTAQNDGVCGGNFKIIAIAESF